MLEMLIMKNKSTTLLELMVIPFHVDFGVGNVVEEQDIQKKQLIGKLQDIDPNFSIHELQDAVQVTEEILPVVLLCVQPAAMEELA